MKGSAMATSFNAKAEYLTRLWTILLYGNAEQAQFAHIWDVSFPLALLIDSGDVEATDSGIRMLEDLWTDACEFLGVDALADYANFQDFIGRVDV